MKEDTNRQILFKSKSGSDLYGLTTANSDVDYVSIFMPTARDLLSLQKCEMVSNNTKSSSENRRNTSEDIDDVSYSLPRFIHLLAHGNPNLTELLFAPDSVVEQTSPIFQEIQKNKDNFLSRKIYDSFMGFAVSQKKKLTYKRERFIQLSSAINVLETVYSNMILQSTTGMSIECAETLNQILKNYKGSKHNNESFHVGLPMKVIYEKIKEERDNYGWRLHTDTFEKLGYDVKFASHTIRLLIECEQLLRTSRIVFPFEGQIKDEIMDVKLGNVSLTNFYELCTVYEDKCRIAYEATTLPENANFEYINTWLVDALSNAIVSERIKE